MKKRILNIAKKYNVSESYVMIQVRIGSEKERKEHPWTNQEESENIALDHLEKNISHYKKDKGMTSYTLNGIGAFSSADFIQDENTGKKVYPKSGSTVNVRMYPGTSAPVLTKVSSGSIGIVLSTYKHVLDGYSWYLIKLDTAVNGKTSGVVATSVVTLQQPTITPANDSTSVNEEIIPASIKFYMVVSQQDQMLYKQLLVTYAQVQILKTKGISTAKIDALYLQLVDRYKARQTRLKNIVAGIAIQYDNPAYQLYDSLKSKFGISSIAAIQIPAAIVIGTVVVASATIAYAVIKALEPEYNSQEVDLKITGEFKKWFDQIPDESVKKTIAAELEAQIDDAYNQGVKDGDGLSFGTIFKYGIVCIAAIYGFNKLMDAADRRNKKYTGNGTNG